MLRAVDIIKCKLADDAMHEAKRIMTLYQTIMESLQ
jgi:hypothetical protein